MSSDVSLALGGAGHDGVSDAVFNLYDRLHRLHFRPGTRVTLF